MFILGFAYVWGIMFLDGFLGQFLAQHNILLPDGLIFGLPVILSVLTICYLIWKKKGFIPIVGIIIGYAMGISLLAIGFGLGNM